MTSIDDRAHANLADFLRWTTLLEPAATLHDRDGVVIAIGPTDWPSSRTAVRATDELGAPEWAAAAESALAPHGRMSCVFARVGADDDLTEALLGAGYQEYAQTPEMVCDGPLPPRPAAGLRLASTEEDIAGYANVADEAFAHLGFSAGTVRDALSGNPELLLSPEVAISVAERDGEIVAGALSVLLGDRPTGYVGWVACADAARGHGLGDAVTRLVTNEAFARGADLVTLEASQFGEHTYARMGYQERYRYRILIKV